jgi:hypothetical protein
MEGIILMIKELKDYAKLIDNMDIWINIKAIFITLIGMIISTLLYFTYNNKYFLFIGVIVTLIIMNKDTYKDQIKKQEMKIKIKEFELLQEINNKIGK